MSINVTSRGVLYNFPTGTKRGAINSFLKKRFADGMLIKENGFVNTDEKIKDGLYTVRTSLEANLNYTLHHYEENKKRTELEHERKLQELREEYHYRRIAWLQTLFWRTFVTVPSIGKVKQRPSLELRRVRFDPSTTITTVYLPNSCTMAEPLLQVKPPMRPNQEYFDLPVYRGNRITDNRKRKACLLTDIEGGWVIVSKGDFENGSKSSAEGADVAITEAAAPTHKNVFMSADDSSATPLS